MAINNDFKYQGLTGTSFYVSAFYGDDANPGTKLLPFKTKAKAELTGSNGDNIIIGTGFYVEQVSASTNSYKYFGEGRVVISQPVGPTDTALHKSTERVENIIFFNWGSQAVIKHDVDTNAVFINCQIIDCKIIGGVDSSFGYYIGCIFDTVEFENTGAADPSPTAGGIINCIFRETNGTLPALQDYTDGVFNNHFVESDTLMIGIAIGQPVDKFDFNNIEGGLNGEVDNAAIQALGFNINGSAFLSVDIFNDFDIFRNPNQFFRQDYTQKNTSPVLLTSKNGSIITRFEEGMRLDAVFLEANNADISNINLVVDQLQLDGGETEGFIINEIDLGSIKTINLINIYQEIGWNTVSGRAEQQADFLEDAGANIKGTFDIEIQHKKEISDSFTVSVIEYDKYMLDRTPQLLEARFLRINLTLRDNTI